MNSAFDASSPNFNQLMTNKAPELIAPSAQIANPPLPKLGLIDVPEKGLLCPDELANIRILSQQIEEAKKFLSFLYSYRSFSFSLNRSDIFKKIYQESGASHLTETFNSFYEPRLRMLLELNILCDRIVDTIVSIIKNDTKPTEVLFEKLMQIFDLLFNINSLKLLKAGINNDLSYYKRDPSLRTPEKSRLQADLMKLQLFLSTKNVTFFAINQKLTLDSPTPQPSFQFMSKFLEFIVARYNNSILVPSRYAQIITSISATFIIHGTTNQPNNIFKCSCIKDVLKILQENPVGILYGDNCLLVGQVLRDVSGCPKIGIPEDQAQLRPFEPKFLVRNQMKEFRALYRESLTYASRIAREGVASEDSLRKILSTVSKMSLTIQLQSTFKFICMKPSTDEAVNKYDLAVRLNYPPEDLNALIELIGYIKTLASTIISAEPSISQFTNKFVHDSVESFIVETLQDPIERAKESKDLEAEELLERIQSIFEWNGSVPPTLHQLDVLRAQVEIIVSQGSKFTTKQSIFAHPHFKPKIVSQSLSFLDESREWPTFLSYVDVVRESTNLGCLWFRETFIDICKVLQFPVRSSLPFIFVEHLLRITNEPALHDSFFFPFELYNDAAALAIRTFDSQYLYKEIEAEVTLCVDMITFSFSETFYKFCRETAAAMELPQECLGMIKPTPMRYPVIVQQSKMELLGSSVDFNLIATKKLNSKLRSELENYIDMINDLRAIVYVAHLVRVAKTTHELLGENHLKMDDFTQIWERAVGSENPLVLENKVVTKVCSSIDFSKMKFNCSSKRFLITKPLELSSTTTEDWAKVYLDLHKRDINYVGAEHLKAMDQLIGKGGVAVFVRRCISRLEEAAALTVEYYTQIASSLKLLPAIHRDDLSGFYTFNSDAYSAMSHPLLGKLFDSMRVVGNTIAFLWIEEGDMASGPAGGGSILTPAMDAIKRFLIENSELFFWNGSLDLESTLTHRSFASLWGVLEFLLCSPKAIALSEGENSIPVVPLEAFGDGPIVAAHTIITLCEQEALYSFDSLVSRVSELDNAARSKITQKDLATFLLHANIVDQARKFAELISSPFQIQKK